MRKMSALSVWQPWAWLIVNGYKDIENRRWEPTEERIGERFAIHASKRRVTKAEFQEFLETVRDRKIKRYPRSIDDFDYGKLVGTAVLVGVGRGTKSYWAARGQFHWKLKSIRKIVPKLVKRGYQSWFTVRL